MQEKVLKENGLSALHVFRTLSLYSIHLFLFIKHTTLCYLFCCLMPSYVHYTHALTLQYHSTCLLWISFFFFSIFVGERKVSLENKNIQTNNGENVQCSCKKTILMVAFPLLWKSVWLAFDYKREFIGQKHKNREQKKWKIEKREQFKLFVDIVVGGNFFEHNRSTRRINEKF